MMMLAGCWAPGWPLRSQQVGMVSLDLTESDRVLLRSIEGGDVPGMRKALAAGANPNTMREVRTGESDPMLQYGAMVGVTKELNPALAVAASLPGPTSAPMAALLLKHGAGVDFCGPLQITALMEAARAANLPVLKLLLAHGADPNLRSSATNHFSAAHYAVVACTHDPLGVRERPACACLQALVRAGCDPGLGDRDGDTAENFAAQARCGGILFTMAFERFRAQSGSTTKWTLGQPTGPYSSADAEQLVPRFSEGDRVQCWMGQPACTPAEYWKPGTVRVVRYGEPGWDGWAAYQVELDDELRGAGRHRLVWACFDDDNVVQELGLPNIRAAACSVATNCTTGKAFRWPVTEDNLLDTLQWRRVVMHLHTQRNDVTEHDLFVAGLTMLLCVTAAVGDLSHRSFTQEDLAVIDNLMPGHLIHSMLHFRHQIALVDSRWLIDEPALSPFHVACKMGNNPSASALLHAGCAVELQSGSGRTGRGYAKAGPPPADTSRSELPTGLWGKVFHMHDHSQVALTIDAFKKNVANRKKRAKKKKKKKRKEAAATIATEDAAAAHLESMPRPTPQSALEPKPEPQPEPEPKIVQSLDPELQRILSDLELTRHSAVLVREGFADVSVLASCRAQDWEELGVPVQDGGKIARATRQHLGLPIEVIDGAGDDY